MELKLQLLSEKATELKELFEANPYEKLVNLKFVIEEAKPEKPKRKYTKKKKEENNNVVVAETTDADKQEEQ